MTKIGTVKKENLSETWRDGDEIKKEEVEGKRAKSRALIIRAHCETID